MDDFVDVDEVMRERCTQIGHDVRAAIREWSNSPEPNSEVSVSLTSTMPRTQRHATEPLLA